jgi:tripartite-type tricarboxylate transporter receptor subunit TctC
MKELGYDIEFYLWVGLFAPKGTPEPIVTKIRDFTRQVAMSDKFKELMGNIGQEVAYLDQDEFRAFWDQDAKRVEDAVRLIGKVEG